MKGKNFMFGAVLAILAITSCAGPAGADQKPAGTLTARTFVAPTLVLTPDAPSPTDNPSPTATETASPAPLPTLTATATSQPPGTPTLTPTPPPPLPLRDDLPPLTLKDWPRPENDNGLGIHFLVSGYFSDAELDKQIARIQSLHLKWVLVLYADENQLSLAAPKFKAAGIMVVWRKTLRPYERYLSWGRDIDILNGVGMPPYMQLYNEPELPAEWDGNPIDPAKFQANLLQAAKDVYNAGGYPGIQFLDEDSLREFITQVYARKGEALFHRMFFVAHSYGLNHPPDYTQDINGVLGFVQFAHIMQQRLGFIPPIIVGEGGWKVGEEEDNRFPPIDETLHRDYTLAVYNWFRTRRMSNGAPLPDYLFAFCHWMLAGATEAGAWYDSFNGDRTLTIQAVQQMPLFTRKFSWDK
jgi:hypothetical protein